MLTGSCPAGALQSSQNLLGKQRSKLQARQKEYHLEQRNRQQLSRGVTILDLMGISADELILNVKIGGSLGCSDHALVKFAVLRDMGQAKNKVRPLNFRKADFQLFKEIVSETHWETSLRDKGVEQRWQSFKEVLLRVQELAVSRNKKLGKEGKGTAGLSRELLVRLKGKKQI